jgi:Ca2+-binding RTX toxin-like protein
MKNWRWLFSQTAKATVHGARRAATQPSLERLETRVNLAPLQFLDPNPSTGNGFGTVVLPLSTGNVVVTAPGDDAGGTDAGAVYLFNGATGQLISTLRGSSAYNSIGSSGITALSSGNYLVLSPNWDNGTATNAGAVTWGSGTAGVSGVVGPGNSLVGSSEADGIGFGGVTVLSNGNYVLSNSLWDNGAAMNAGAVTWGSGTAGVSGVVSSANSLVGSKPYDSVGEGGVTALSNGNYVVSSTIWDNGTVVDVGAVTWGSGTAGVSGKVSALNSLVGSTAYDKVGNCFNDHPNYPSVGLGHERPSRGIIELYNGNYLVISNDWDNGGMTNAGAVTVLRGDGPSEGIVTENSSLTGKRKNDQPQAIVFLSHDTVNETLKLFFSSDGWAPTMPSNPSPMLKVRIPQSTSFVVFREVSVTGVTVADPTAGSFRLTTELTAPGGKVSLGARSGLQFLAGDGTDDSTMRFTGTVSQTAAALKSLTYLHSSSSFSDTRIDISVQSKTSTVSKSIPLTAATGVTAKVPDIGHPSSGRVSLVIHGTPGADMVVVTPLAGSTTNYRVTLNGVASTVTGITGRLIVGGLGGDDNINLAAVGIAARVDGGDGNDVILGGGMADMLLGGNGADLLAGGLGADIIDGGFGNDIVIDGTVSARVAGKTLRSVLDGWAAKVSPADADHASITFDLLFTADKASKDTLTGGLGTDWFWSATAGAVADVLDKAVVERRRLI